MDWERGPVLWLFLGVRDPPQLSRVQEAILDVSRQEGVEDLHLFSLLPKPPKPDGPHAARPDLFPAHP